MEVYRFETRITKRGQINLPLDIQLSDKEVEIIILSKKKTKPSDFNASDFIKKWTGFLSNSDTDDLKYQYLDDKYK